MENVAVKSGYLIRWEKGLFQGGNCTLEGDQLIVLNRNHPTEVQLGVLARTLKDAPLEEIAMQTDMRNQIEALIQKYSSD